MSNNSSGDNNNSSSSRVFRESPPPTSIAQQQQFFSTLQASGQQQQLQQKSPLKYGGGRRQLNATSIAKSINGGAAAALPQRSSSSSATQPAAVSCNHCGRAVVLLASAYTLKSNNTSGNKSNAAPLLYYHRECFKCTKCDKQLDGGSATPQTNNVADDAVQSSPLAPSLYTLVENKFLYCANCYMKRKPLSASAQMASTTAATHQHHNQVVSSSAGAGGSQVNKYVQQIKQQQQTPVAATTTTGSSLSDLKLRFEQPQPSPITSQIPILLQQSGANASSSANKYQHNLKAQRSSQQLTPTPEKAPPLSNLLSRLTIVHTTSENKSPPNDNNNESSNIPSAPNNNKHQKNLYFQHFFHSQQPSSKTSTTTTLSPPTASETTATTSTGNVYQKFGPSVVSLSKQKSPLPSNNNNAQSFIPKAIAAQPQPKITTTTPPCQPQQQQQQHQHSSKCNVMVRKMRRSAGGLRRSKSLPARFSLDSLLEYLQCAMLSNKYELKRLYQQQQRYMQQLLNQQTQQQQQGSGPSAAVVSKTLSGAMFRGGNVLNLVARHSGAAPKMPVMPPLPAPSSICSSSSTTTTATTNTTATSSSQQFSSSGYQSISGGGGELSKHHHHHHHHHHHQHHLLHDDMADSTSSSRRSSSGAGSTTSTTRSLMRNVNFYRLTLAHLPSMKRIAATNKCTCGVVPPAPPPSSDLVDLFLNRGGEQEDEDEPDEADEVAVDELDDEDEDDEDEDEDEEVEDVVAIEEETAQQPPASAASPPPPPPPIKSSVSPLRQQKPTTFSHNPITTALLHPLVQLQPSIAAAVQNTDSFVATMSNQQQIQQQQQQSFYFYRLKPAPGTSTCPHTARVDLRRTRSLRNLALGTNEQQRLFSAEDFTEKREKLGEGFFANVSKVVSKASGCPMVLKELKINGCCFTATTATTTSSEERSTTPPPPPQPASQPPPPPSTSKDDSTTTTTDADSSGSTSNSNSSTNTRRESASSVTAEAIAASYKFADFLFNYSELNAAHKSFLKEAQVLRNLNHPNVIKLMGIMFTKEKHLNLVLEYIGGGTLKDIIHDISTVLPWTLRVGYARDIAAALEYLHSLNIIHRDLKSDNCLVRENGRTVVVADFGLSRIINNNNNLNATCSSYAVSSSLLSNGGTAASGASGGPGDDVSYMMTPPNRFAHHQHYHRRFHQFTNDFLLDNSGATVSATTTESNSSKQPQTPTNSFIVAAKRKLKRNLPPLHHHRRQAPPPHRYAVVGNSFSMAPEMLKHQVYDERVDIFSFGIICCEIIGRVQADPDYLPRTSDFGLNVELFRKKYCEADCPKHFIQIAIACCELEPEKRPPFAKTHRWLETIQSHLESNQQVPKNLLKNILESSSSNKNENTGGQKL